MDNFSTMFNLPYTKLTHNVLVCYYCLTNCQAFSSLKKHTYLLTHSFCGSGAQARCSRILRAGSPETASKASAWMFSSAGGISASRLIQAVGRINFLVVVGLRAPVASEGQLGAVLSSLPRGHPEGGSSSMKSARRISLPSERAQFPSLKGSHLRK